MSGNTIVEMVSKELNLLPYQERMLQRLVNGENISVVIRAGWNTVRIAYALTRMIENSNLDIVVPNEEVRQRFPESFRSRVVVEKKC